MLSTAQLQTLKASVPSSSGGSMGASSSTPYATPEQAKAAFTGIPSAPAPKSPSESSSGAPMFGLNISNPISDISNIYNAAKSGVQQVVGGFQDAKNAGNNPIKQQEAALKTGAGIVNTVMSPAAPAMKPVNDIVQNIGELASNIPAVQQFANTSAGQTTSRVAEDVANASTVAGAVVGGMAGPEALKPGEAPITEAPLKVPTPKTLDTNAVMDNYNRAVRPSVAGKNTAAQLAKSRTDTVSGLQAIVDNKANLKLTDVNGEVKTGQTPSTLAEHLDAVSQTKSAIYKQYNDLSVQAGQKGISVDPVNIGTELSQVINNKALKISNPDAIKYAQDLQARLVNEGSIDAETAQQVIKNYNDELQSFYKNPTPGMASKVQIDAMVANRMRAQLDEGITNATGEQYQPLKNQYGALSRMEAEATKRAQVFARQNKVGLAANISNIASGAELVRGLLTGNPVDVIVGGGIKAIQLYEKYLNNPDTAIKNMYASFDGTSPTPTSNTPQTGIDKTVSSSKTTTSKPTSQ